MERSESGLHAPKHRVTPGLTLSIGALVAGCASLVALEHRSCPCADGWVCCEATSLCLRPEESCAPGGQGGSAGTSVASGGSGAGGRGGASGASSGSGGNAGNGGKGGTSQGGQAGETAGSSGDGGMGGEPPPEWRPVGPALLEDPVTTSETDLELAPDGTPYLAFRGCEDCDLLTLTHVPVVERYDGRWLVLPKDGLPTTTVTTPSLSIDTNGMLHLLVDRVVSSFDGDVWHPLASALPGTTATDSNFQIDGDGNYWATLFDGARNEITVVRFAAGGWGPIGPAVSGKSEGVRLVVGSDGAYLAHTATDGAHVFVRKFSGTDWVGDELEGELVELAQAPDASLYVAVSPRAGVLTLTEVELLHGTVGNLAVTGSLGTSWAPPGLGVSSDGTLFAVFLVEDFVNVNRWDGMNFRDLGGTLGNGATPVLRLFEAAGGVVPFAAYGVGAALAVKKYE